MPEFLNRFGRRPGRGIRPWLLVPKVLGVGAYFGGLTAATAISWAANPQTLEQWHDLGWTLRAVFLFAAVPGLCVAIVFGLLLWLQHPRELGRMRWLRVKLVVLVLTIPPSHFVISMMVRHIRTFQPGLDSFTPTVALNWTRIGLVWAVLVAGVVIWLGRHKPRLGQRFGPR